jgi:hypothetical protein
MARAWRRRKEVPPMNDSTEIRPLSDARDIDSSFEVMKQLRPHLE